MTATTLFNKVKLIAMGLGLMAGVEASAQTDTAAGYTAEPDTGVWDTAVVRRPVMKEHSALFAFGHTSILDTYLSQETFTGSELRYVSQVMRRREGSRVSSEITHHVLLSMAGTRGNKNSLLTALYNFKFGWYYGWPLAGDDLTLQVGGLVDGVLGGSYNTRNSNNPAQARIALSLDPSAKVSWRFRLGHKPLRLNYEASMPWIGLAFSPNYGQSYYEIFSKGNYDHNIVVASPFSGVQLYQRLTLDFRIWKTTFSIGYLGDIRQMKANSLKYHHYTHALVVGWKY